MVAAFAALSRDRFEAPRSRSECRPDEYATQVEHETESGRPGKGEPPYTILDFGCGPGRDLKVFAELGHIAVDAASAP